MKAIFAVAIAALMLATPSIAGQKKKSSQTQVTQSQAATSNNQTSVRHARLRFRAYVQPATTAFSSY
jgi:hypothetical protein